MRLVDKNAYLPFIKFQAVQDAPGPKFWANKRQISTQLLLAPNFHMIHFFVPQSFFERGGPSKQILIANFAVESRPWSW